MASLMKGDEDSYTHPIKCSALRKGGYVLLKEKPCKIVEMSTAKPGKHGHAKVHLVGLDLFTSKKVEDVFPSTHTVSVPNVSKQELMVSNVAQDGSVSVLQDNGELLSGLQLNKTCGKSGEEVLAMFEQAMDTDTDDLLVQLTGAMGKQVITEVKIKKARI